ncbi:MAG: hypothetical protein MJ089_04165 [Ruminococcus sp.]|nr:hypothetical protein [Ruminococcus sp.]
MYKTKPDIIRDNILKQFAVVIEITEIVKLEIFSRRSDKDININNINIIKSIANEDNDVKAIIVQILLIINVYNM